jgi:DNA-binding IclR family transcriptional regulator
MTASVLDRILAILDAVHVGEPVVTITEIAERTELPKSTVSRLVAAMVEQRYLARTESGVTLGLRLFELGSRSTLPRRLRAVASPVVRELWEATGERVGLWVNRGLDMVSVAAVPGRLPALPTRAGYRSPALTTASGKAYLAFCADERIVRQVSGHLPEDAAQRYLRELREVRRSSVAFDAGVAYPGIVAVASPVLSAAGTVVGAISIAGPDGELDAERIARLVHSAGLELSSRLAA